MSNNTSRHNALAEPSVRILVQMAVQTPMSFCNNCPGLSSARVWVCIVHRAYDPHKHARCLFVCLTPSTIGSVSSLFDPATVEECAQTCIATSTCTGFEHHTWNGGECELHSSVNDFHHTAPVAGCTCWRVPYRTVTPNGCCRTQDGSEGTFEDPFSATQGACQHACSVRSDCMGFEYVAPAPRI